MKNIIKKVFFIILLFNLIFFTSCFSENRRLYSIKLFSIDKTESITNFDFEPYKNYKFSIIKYRQYFVYFFDKYSNTFYKFSKTGDQLLKISNLKIDDEIINSIISKKEESPNENINTKENTNNKENKNIQEIKNLEEKLTPKTIDKSYLNPIDKETISTKISREFPFPDILDFYVDFDGNIIFKVSIQDDKLIEALYKNENIKTTYLFKESETLLKENYNSPLKNEKIIIFFMKFNKFGDFEEIILNSESYPYFPYLTSISVLKNNNFIFSSLIPNNPNYDLFMQSLSIYQFVYTDKDFNIINNFTFSTINLPLTNIEKEKSYQYFIINYLIDYYGNIYFYTTFYDKVLPVYSKIYLIEDFSLNSIKIYLVKNLIEVDKNTNQKYAVLEDLPIGIDEFSNIFFTVRLINKPQFMKISIIDKDRKIFFKSNIKTENIYSENQFYIGEDGALITYSEKKNKFEIYYFGTDIIVKQHSQK